MSTNYATALRLFDIAYFGMVGAPTWIAGLGIVWKWAFAYALDSHVRHWFFRSPMILLPRLPGDAWDRSTPSQACANVTRRGVSWLLDVRIAIPKQDALRDVRIVDRAGVVWRCDLAESHDAAFVPDLGAVIVVQPRLRLKAKREARWPDNRDTTAMDFQPQSF